MLMRARVPLKERNETSKQTLNQTLDMKTKSVLRAITVLPIAMLLSSNALADPVSRPVSTKSRAGQRVVEPRRIYDLESGNFIDNPDYHAPAVVKQAARSMKAVGEPRRIYDLRSRNFIDNPDYHAPAVFKRAARSDASRARP